MAYRSAIIGYGGMGAWHHSNIGEKVPRIEVQSAYDVRPEALVKAQNAGLRIYDSMQALLDDDTIDLVTIATPNNFHKELSIACMRAGKHVVCEKPVTLNASELEAIISAAKETGRLFSVHQNRRWDRDYLTVKHARDTGLLGRVYFIESKVQGSRRSMHGWRGYKQNGGGMLLDWGVHLLDQLMDMIDAPVISVEAHLLSIFTPSVDDNIKVMLRFADGCTALLEMATNCFINAPRWHVCGTDGTLQIDDWDVSGRIVQLHSDGAMTWEDDIVYTEAGPTRTMAPRPSHTTAVLPLPEVQADWSEYYNNIADVLDGTAELIVRPEQCLRVMRVIDLLFQSDAEKTGLRCEI